MLYLFYNAQLSCDDLLIVISKSFDLPIYAQIKEQANTVRIATVDLQGEKSTTI